MSSRQTEMEIEAYAFRQLVAHLKNRNDVQNIDVMNLTGFCRNCLSKWYYKGALVNGRTDITYDDACEVVYGEPYGEEILATTAFQRRTRFTRACVFVKPFPARHGLGRWAPCPHDNEHATGRLSCSSRRS